MNGEKSKLVSPPQGMQVGQGAANQASQLFGEGIGNTREWVEIHRTADDWEVKLIQATLGAQQIRCRPVQLKKERQTALLVAPAHEVAALELVSRIDVAIADNEMTARFEDEAEALKQRDLAAIDAAAPQQTIDTDSGEMTLAEQEDIGSVVYVVGQGYELRVGPEPYITVAESEWEEFTDFSAQRQEFFILLRHEYPTLFEWLQQEKLVAKFIRLIEMTYQDGAPIPTPPRSHSDASDVEELAALPYNLLAQLSLAIAVVSFIAVLFQVSWYVNLVLAGVAVVLAIVAKYQIDASEGHSTGVPMALSAIVLACLVVFVAWWLEQRPPPVEEPQKPPAREMVRNR